MSVFISYSHLDESFVDKLCLELVRFNIPVWRDKQQMQLGDSIVTNIQDALEKASFICYVISNNSVNSGWVKREISAVLHREVEDVNCTILPLVIDDCPIPLFIRDKLYADFRKDFDAGVRMIVNAVAEKYNLFAGKLTNKGKTTSYATDVITYTDKHIEINIDIISQDDDHEYFLLTKLKIIGNEKALEQYQLYAKDGEAAQFVSEVFNVLGQLPEIKNKRIVVGGAKLARVVAEFENAENGLVFRAETITKKVGEDNGKYILFNLGLIFQLHSET